MWTRQQLDPFPHLFTRAARLFDAPSTMNESYGNVRAKERVCRILFDPFCVLVVAVVAVV